jgi:alpha-tubulin suppressor-like RCC1 family protein
VKLAFRPIVLLTFALATSAGISSEARDGRAQASPASNILVWGDNSAGQLGLGVAASDALVQVSGLPAIVSVAGGDAFSLAVTRGGAVWAWGNDDHGQLGIGRVTAVVRPAQVPGLHNIVAVAAGAQHGLALDGHGTVWAWGDNKYGQRGTGGMAVSASPSPIKDLGNVREIAAGGWRSLALLRDGTVWEWGDNDNWQLGESVDYSSGSLVQVPGLRNIVSVTRGLGFSLALRRDGTVWAWGTDEEGQLGPGASYGDSVDTPIQVRGLPAVAAIAAGIVHSVALDRNGTVWTWGGNAYYQLGVAKVKDQCGNFACTDMPLRAPGLPAVAAIAAGGYRTAALTRAGAVWNWGNGTPSITPSVVTGLGVATAIAEGGAHMLALGPGGSVTAWGNNDSGQLGIAPPEECGTGQKFRCQTVPTFTVGPAEATAISSGSTHSLALGRDGTVWSWGDNSSGQLGDGTKIDRFSPVRARGLQAVKAISAGEDFSMALGRDGTVWAWGSNVEGQLGNGSTHDSSVPLRIASLHGIIAISAGGGFSLALQNNGTIWAWGSDDSGQLGRATQQTCGDKSQDLATPCVTSPVMVKGVSGIIAVAAGGGNSLALKRDGTVWAWGDDSSGQLGRGTSQDSSTTPAPVRGLHDIVAIAAGSDGLIANFNMSLRRDGTVWAWGGNGDGQLGIGNTTDSAVAVRVHGLGSVSAIAAGSAFGLALLHDGSVWGWGDANNGQLGATAMAREKCGTDEPDACATTPARVPGLHAVSAIAAGSDSSLAIVGTTR